jgi:hypothetical protein
MDKVVDKIAALGVPGLVLLVAMQATGWAGGAAIVTALAALGGPLGMLGGIAVLLVLSLTSKGLTVYGLEKLFTAAVAKLKTQGLSTDDIRTRVQSYRVSKSLKLKLLHHLDNLEQTDDA